MLPSYIKIYPAQNQGCIMHTLFAHAQKMQLKAHAPYSSFFVGAALLTSDDIVIGGCNVESASYGLTMCAERNAIFSAIAQGHKSFKAMALAAPTSCTPCGACRQIIVEICGNIPIVIKYEGSLQIVQAYDLLPKIFTLTDQKQ